MNHTAVSNSIPRKEVWSAEYTKLDLEITNSLCNGQTGEGKSVPHRRTRVGQKSVGEPCVGQNAFTLVVSCVASVLTTTGSCAGARHTTHPL